MGLETEPPTSHVKARRPAIKRSRAAVAARDEGAALAREQEVESHAGHQHVRHISCSPPGVGLLVGPATIHDALHPVSAVNPTAGYRSAVNSPVSRSSSS